MSVFHGDKNYVIDKISVCEIVTVIDLKLPRCGCVFGSKSIVIGVLRYLCMPCKKTKTVGGSKYDS